MEIIAYLLEKAATVIEARFPRDEAVAIPALPPHQAPYVEKPGIVAPAVKNDFKKEFVEATKIAGVPVEWATNKSLERIVDGESRFNPEAKNLQGSSAFGLFQMVEKTWNYVIEQLTKRVKPDDESKIQHGTDDVVWQAAAGMWYIHKRYGTPEIAEAFRNATLAPENEFMRLVTELPEKLRKQALDWRAKGWKGY